MTFNLSEIFAGVLICVLCLIPIRELKKEYAPLISTALSVLLFGIAFKRGMPLFQYIKSIGEDDTEVYFEIIFKCFGIAVSTNLLTEICSDFGFGSVSGKVEFIGKLAILMTCIPLTERLFSLVEVLL